RTAARIRTRRIFSSACVDSRETGRKDRAVRDAGFVAAVVVSVLVLAAPAGARPDPAVGRAQCDAAHDFLAVGDRDQAKALYAAAVENRASCGLAGLKSLE